MNDRRRLWMLVALGLIAALFVGDKVYQNWYATPLREKENLHRTLSEELHATKLKIKLAEKKLPEIDKLERRSLPYDLELAVSAYRSWLFQLIEETNLKRTNVDSGQPVRVGKLFDRLTFTMHGSGSLDQVIRFLHKFYSAGHLHSIRSLNFNPTATGRIDISISIETLALLSAASKDSLSDAKSNQLARADESDYGIIARRNVFSPSAGSWLTETRVSAITKNTDGKYQVWLDAPGVSTTLIVDEGGTTIVAGNTVHVTTAGNEQATLSIDGDELIVGIGQSLSEAIE